MLFIATSTAGSVTYVFDGNTKVVRAFKWEGIGVSNIFYVIVRYCDRHSRSWMDDSVPTVDNVLRYV